MDPGRSQRFGKPYFRANYMPPNTRQTLEDRLHPPGISTSSNSSWTFSNSHCDVPKMRKGRLCGIFLIGAVLVVALAVVAIAGLAFYIGGYTTERNHVSEFQTKEPVGAKRQFSTKQIETTPKGRISPKTTTTSEEPPESTQSTKKAIPEGAILGISKTMQQLNGFKNKKKEETTTTELPEDVFTEYGEFESDSVTDVEIIPEKSTKPTETIENQSFNPEKKVESVTNGHARPLFPETNTTTPPPQTVFPPKRDYSDEPWRPIIPSYRDTIRIKPPYKEHEEKVIDHRYGPLIEPVIENDSPITFSKESYEQNLRITPEYTGNNDKFKFHNNYNSRISDEIAVKYRDLIKDHKIGSSEGIAEVVVTSDDIVTAPPAKPSDIIIVSELSTSSTLSTHYNATEDTKTAEKAKKPSYPIGVDQILSGISVIESKVEALTTKPTNKATAKTTMESTTKTITTTEEITSSNKSSQKMETTAKTTVKSRATVATTETPPSSPTATSVRPKNLTTTAKPETTTKQPNTTVKNPFLDDSRASASNFNFGLPELPILKQFHHLDSLLKSFAKPETGNQYSKYFVRSDDGNETAVTRFPARTKQTTVKNYKKDDTIYVEVSTISAEPATRKPVVIKGEVEVVSGPIKQGPPSTTTEIPKLITLLPVRSNVNMMRPLRPRPKSNINSTITVTTRRKSKMSPEFKRRENVQNPEMLPPQQHEFINDENGKRWIYYSSSNRGVSQKNEKLFIVTPEPKSADPEDGFLGNLTNLPLYNTIESLLNSDHRNKEVKNSMKMDGSEEEEEDKGRKNTSEIIEKIVKIVENVAIFTGDSTNVITKVNQTVVNRTTEDEEKMEERSDGGTGISTKVISSHYKLNTAGVPILTKVLHKAHNFQRQEEEEEEEVKMTPSYKDITELNAVEDCSDGSVKCGNGSCLPASKKCDQFIDCPDAADEKNCTCAEHLKAQQLHRKLCDGVVDCWDFSDEYNCEWCQEEFLCSNSRVCIKKEQICDGENNCPLGDDERNCVTVSPSKTEAETFNYHHNGYLMVRKNGHWGKLCIDNFHSVSLKSKTGWKISDLGRTVCKALTFKDFDKVEKMTSVPNEGRSVGSGEAEKYYELAYNEVSDDRQSSRDSMLSFHETECEKKEVVKVTCSDLECGLRPQATNQWSRIVGGGNAGPGSWPWQAALYKEGEFQCGATLISDNWLISAGHCFYHNQDAYWVARLGTLRTTLLLPSPYEQLRQISKIILHPQYIDNGFINDISLLRMRDPVKFTDYVRPICLPKPEEIIKDGTMCTVIGWGQLSEVGWVFPDTLQEVQLPILSSNECRKRTIFLPLYKITDDMFCAGYERGGRDACLGDSGGPLMCQEADGKWSLLGVTSNGYGCARSNRPGVYTKVSKYLQWIQSQMTLHSDLLSPVIDFDEKQTSSTSRNFTETEQERSPEEKHEETDYVLKLVAQRVSNVKTSGDSGKSRDKCKGHRCPLGECLPKSRLCNGHIECSDGSDEKDCW